MSSNFGTGQGFFNNQNKTQGTAAPGSTPAPGTSAFGGLGSNTTSGSAFGGAGAGNTSGGGGTASAPTGSVFGAGGSAFGGGGFANASTSTPSGAGTAGGLFGGPSLFAGVHMPYFVFMKSSHANTTQQILRQVQGLRRQRQGACSQMQVRTQVLLGRRQDKVYLAIPPAQLRAAGLEVVRTNYIITEFRKWTSYLSIQDPCLVFRNLRPLVQAPSLRARGLPLAPVEAVATYFLAWGLAIRRQRRLARPPAQVPLVGAFSGITNRRIVLLSPRPLPVSMRQCGREI